ncbi:UvrD-helicase domain-containing protein [Providencia vermicola]|uniref:UvrD-helicase domain-containing protein n=1 Tax=Providencia vermicola TaxID=333965 RepID=UPI0032DA3533
MLPNEREEQEIQESLYRAVKSHTSFRFNAGAGAGKTYALVEVLKFLLSNNLETLNKRNQNIYCVTYTNVAVNEIKSRLGNSDVVIVSTIHEMLWKLIKQYQLELVKCHRNKLESELEKINNNLNGVIDKSKGAKDKNPFKFYLDIADKDEFQFFIKSTKNIFYENQNAKSEDFKTAYKNINNLELNSVKLEKCLKNVANFKVVAKAIYKKNRYEECIKNIKEKNPNYTEVLYDNVFNSDRLDKMRFSHDTLLEYAKELIVGNDILKRIIIDKYPFVFIDEYQDTSTSVVKIMAAIHQYAKSQNKHWVVGYFGDTAQNIYDDGIGKNIINIHSDFKDIDKKFNRRSHKQIVDIANKVRNDEIKQEVINNKKNDGEFDFYHKKIDCDLDNKQLARKFTEWYLKQRLGKNGKEKLDCLVLTNKLMAELIGFGEVYGALTKPENFYYKDINSQILSHEVSKLNSTVRIIYNIINMYLIIRNEKSTYYDVFGHEGKKLSFLSVNYFLDSINSIEPVTLGDLISSLSSYYDASKNLEPFYLYMDKILGDKNNDIEKYENFYSLLRTELFEFCSSDSSKDDDTIDNDVNNILNVKITDWILWAKYINREQDGDIRYHTYHGTKGEEYENVVIIMEHSFGNNYQGRDKFKKFFENRKQALDENQKRPNPITDDEEKEFFNTQNLVYVACSRAIKNLAILYLDDISDIKKGLESIFGEVQEWSPAEDEAL